MSSAQLLVRLPLRLGREIAKTAEPGVLAHLPTVTEYLDEWALLLDPVGELCAAATKMDAGLASWRVWARCTPASPVIRLLREAATEEVVLAAMESIGAAEPGRLRARSLPWLTGLAVSATIWPHVGLASHRLAVALDARYSATRVTPAG